MKTGGLALDRLLTRSEVEQEYGISKRFLEIAAVRGDGPPMVRLGSRMVRYRVRSVLAYLDARTVLSTSQHPGEQCDD